MPGSSVLVHGLWGHPEDWNWVTERLRRHAIECTAVDLPSHRSAAAGRAADTAVVAQAIVGSTPPVVVVGWSYGGDLLSDAAAGQGSVARVVYASSVPRPVPTARPDSAEFHIDPHWLLRPDGSFVLDDEWWLTEGNGATLPSDVIEHMWRYRRRPASVKTLTELQVAAAWQTIPTTVLIGRFDELVSEEDRLWLNTRLDDVRLLDTDHLVIFRHPDVLAHIVIDALDAAAHPD